MAQKGITALLADIVAKVFQNSNKSVTGQDVQDIMVDMTDSLNQSTYNALIAYNVGQSVIFDDSGIKKLYECIINTTAGESPTSTPSKWDIITGGATGSSDIKVAKSEILYTNTAQTTIITLPTNAVVWNIGIEVVTLFDDSGTDLLDIGITGTGDRYVNNYALSGGAGFITYNYLGDGGGSYTQDAERFTTSTNITFQYTGQNSDATQGQAFVYIHYSLH